MWSWRRPTVQSQACTCCLQHCLIILSSQSTWTCSQGQLFQPAGVNVTGVLLTLTASAAVCVSPSCSWMRRTTVPVWSNATTLHYSHCSTDMPCSLSSNHALTSTRRGTTDSAGLPKQPRDVLSVPIANTSPSQIEQHGISSPNYSSPHYVGATPITGRTW